MKNTKNILTVVLGALSLIAGAQQTPASAVTESVLITGATAHIGDGTIIENSAIGINSGKITFVGTASEGNNGNFSKVINASGKHVYPGFTAINTTLGLVEIDAVKASVDQSEMGDIIPNVRSLIAYNAESQVVESMRPNGVFMAQVTPRGGRISGTSSIVQLDAWNWEDAAVKVDDAIHMNWPNSFSRGRWWMGEDPGLKPNQNYSKQVDEVKQFLVSAKAYLAGDKSPVNLTFEAVKGLFDGTQRLFISVDGEKEITDAVNFSNKTGIKYVAIIGGDQADKVADLLVKNNVAVILSNPHRIPESEDENIKHPFMLAKLLSDAGVLIGIDAGGGPSNIRNLPFYAGTCAAYGLDAEKAVQLITENSARILGIDDFAGTLKVGKDATLFISEGDALDMKTNIISKAYIQGRDVSLETHQTELWKRYMKKYEGK